MRVEKFDGVIASWWSKSLTSLKLKDGSFNTVPSLKFEGEFTAYGPDKAIAEYVDADWKEAIDEMVAANDYPSAQEIVTLRNDKRKAKARQASMTAEVLNAGLVQPTLENDDQLRLKKAYEVLLVSVNRKTGIKHTEAEAREKAADMVGADWAK
jgi:hypothetical protein